MHVLCITRKYPPSRGGMETFSAELERHVNTPHTLLAESGRSILVSVLRLFFRSLPHLRTASVIHIEDGVLAPLGAFLHLMSKKPIIVTLHGLELTSNYGGAFYHGLLRWSLPYITHWVAVSHYTRALAIQYGITSDRLSVIPHGVTISPLLSTEKSRKTLTQRYPHLRHRRIILSVGRLVERKGLAWFTSCVLPHLPQDVLLCIVSNGPYRAHIQAAAEMHGVAKNILFCGAVSTEELALWYAACDAFIFPNIPVPYDVEGFGLTAVEASAAGAAVFATRIHGIIDAVVDGATGTLLPVHEPRAWINALTACLSSSRTEQQRAEVQSATQSRYRWDTAATHYTALYTRLTHL